MATEDDPVETTDAVASVDARGSGSPCLRRGRFVGGVIVGRLEQRDLAKHVKLVAVHLETSVVDALLGGREPTTQVENGTRLGFDYQSRHQQVLSDCLGSHLCLQVMFAISTGCPR